MNLKKGCPWKIETRISEVSNIGEAIVHYLTLVMYAISISCIENKC